MFSPVRGPVEARDAVVPSAAIFGFMLTDFFDIVYFAQALLGAIVA